MKKNPVMIALWAMGGMLLLGASSLSAQTTLKLQLTSRVAHENSPVVVNLSPYGRVDSASVTIDGREVPVQLDDLDGDCVNDELCFLADMGRKDRKEAVVRLYPRGHQKQYEARTFAEIVLRNPNVKEKNKHDIYLSSISIDQATKNPYNVLHHHGVAFENELIAMRIYMDQRQTVDLYGKQHKGLELRQTQFYPSPEQKAEGYGDDVLWVGNTFGLGALRGWDGTQPTMIAPVASRTQRILCQGPVRTIVEVEDHGWQIAGRDHAVNMTERYTLYAGHRDVSVDVSFSEDMTGSNFSTGVINVKQSEEYTDHDGLRGCWGTDWPSTDTLHCKRETVGLAVYVPKETASQELPANKDNYGFVIPGARSFHYYIAYTSANEDFGYHSAKEWFDWMKQWKTQLTDTVAIKRIAM